MNATPAPMPAVNPWLPRMFRIAEIIAEIPSVRTFRLAPESDETPDFLPGQFNMVYLPGYGEAAISISSGSHELRQMDHTIRAVGDVTKAIMRLGPGDQVGIRGPFGNPWPVARLRGKDVLLVAGGIGLAPLRPVIEYLLQNRREFGELKLIYGAKTPEELLYQRQFPAWAIAGLEMEVTVDRGTSAWKGHIGVVTELMRPLHGAKGKTTILTCGPEIMMRFVAREAINLGYDAGEIYVSLERNMKCAMGMCGVCQFGREFICKDGPIFPFPRVASLMQLEDL
ncbi:FAD/NAD(P)-binding protein [Blastopirellula sp. JC732]|uniref:FAD/NAD(P)-binding protein n=1 Tax=Blastopirellula sediminis TaxID=2894196 RepID=A0A9X1MKX8_9BACT|nr:FAD/NAD(P)-binding protein [Blastopirellula sediminis]MCC9608345.1 FAD/NAD(P)-binding protein [Blastopirellula sediminis]MCC9628878.1 FAD/NAD(P)-binding protein [Blastopirellula sediminis]